MYSTSFVPRVLCHDLTIVISSTSLIFQVRIAIRSRAISCLTVHIEHLDRVREKVLLLEENTNRSSGKDFVAMSV